MEEAKQKVEEPPQPKLKINMSAPKPSIKLRFGGQKASPAPSAPDTPAGRSSGTPGVIVDSGALERQQRHVQAGMNGQRPSSSGTPSQTPASRNPFGGSRPGSASIPPIGLDTDQSVAAVSPPAVVNGVKSESQATQSPALNSIRLSSGAPENPKESQRPSVPAQVPQLAGSAMPPPQNSTPRPASGSPHPNPPAGHHSGTQGYHPQSYYTPQPAGFETYRRAPGKSRLGN